MYVLFISYIEQSFLISFLLLGVEYGRLVTKVLEL